MRTSFLSLVFAAAVILIPGVLTAQTPEPTTPNTGGAAGALTGQVLATSSPSLPVAPAATVRREADKAPVRVIAPAIGLNAPIQNMGVLKNGELAVPSGSTNNVGWYAAGPTPGEEGSAVLDAHVFAAFSKLQYLKAGDDIYIVDADGTNLHFKVADAQTYKLSALSPNTLFGSDGQKRLNLITCAGKLTADHSTYDHRLIVYAVLAE